MARPPVPSSDRHLGRAFRPSSQLRSLANRRNRRQRRAHLRQIASILRSIA